MVSISTITDSLEDRVPVAFLTAGIMLPVALAITVFDIAPGVGGILTVVGLVAALGGLYGLYIAKGGGLVLSGRSETNTPPIAQFVLTADGVMVTANGSDSSDPDQDDEVDSWMWSFFDVSTGDLVGQDSGKVVRKEFSSGGEKEVQLTVEDTRGGRDTVSRIVTIKEGGPVQPPEERYGFGEYGGDGYGGSV